METSQIQISSQIDKNRINDKTMRLVKALSDSLAGRSHSKKQLLFSKNHVQRYLFTFAFEVGCDVPNEEVIKSICNLLIGNEQTSSQKQGIQESNFHLMIKICLGVYQQAKKTAIGGIFERVQMAIKQAIYYNKLQNLSENN